MSLYRETVGAGPDIVLLHGWGMNLAVWQPVIAAWQRDFRLTCIELPGHGRSPAPSSDDAAEWVGALLDAAPDRAYWVGWSLGGQLALQAALVAPERVAGLGLIATTPCFVQRADWAPAMPAETFEAFVEQLGADPQALLQRFLTLQVRGDGAARSTLKQLRDALAARPRPHIDGLRCGLALLRDTDLRGRLASLGCAQRWLFGERDALVPVALTAWLAGEVPVAGVTTIAQAGHAPFLSYPQKTLHSLRQSIDGHH
jgi:pimeloyl-[acyl-carrier protein] methyl ester esterase